MSLFPAYSTETQETSPGTKELSEDDVKALEHEKDQSWHHMKSFPEQKTQNVEKPSFSSSRSSSDSEKRRRKSRSRSESRQRSRSRSRSRRSRSRNRRSRHSSASSSSSSSRRSRSRSPSRRRRRRRTRSRSRSRSRSSSSRRRKTKKAKRSSKKTKKSSKKRRRRSRSSSPVTSLPTRSELIAKHSVGKTFLEDVGLRPEEAFTTETRGDSSLTKEKQAPKHKVAIYRARFRHSAMGVGGDRWNPRKPIPRPRFFHKSYVQQFLRDDETVCQLLTDDPARVPQDSVWRVNKISLPLDNPADDPSATDEANPLKVYDMNTVAYIEGRGKATSSKEAALDDPEANESESIKLHFVQERTRSFNQRLRAEPQNEALWLEFVEFQDVSIQDAEFEGPAAKEEGQGDGETSSKKQKKKKAASRNVILKQRALVEKKLSILKTAIEKNPKSIPLAIKRLDLSRELLDDATLDRQWKELIFIFPRNFELWHHYLNFVSSHFTNFRVSRILKAYRSCMQKLKQIQTQSFTSFGDKPVGLEDHMIRVLLSMCNFLARAGYREKSIALLQAMAELNFFSPEFPGYYSLEDRLAMFEPFWESGVPRFGEPGVVGWATVMKKKDNVINQDSVEQAATGEEQIIEKMGPLVDRNLLWLELELLRENRNWCPWRSSEEEAEDPDRMVPYEDIAPFMFQFSGPGSQLKFLVCLLDFLGVRFTPDPYVPSPLNTQSTRKDHLGLNLSENLGSDVSWNPEIIADLIQQTGPRMSGDPGYRTFCRNVFSQSTRVLKEPIKTQMTLMWLKFELYDIATSSEEGEEGKSRKSRAKELKALVQSLLKDDQNNIDIYIGFARVEFKLSGFKSAWKILEMALLSRGKACHVPLYIASIGICIEQLEQEQNADKKRSLVDQILRLSVQAGQGKPYEKAGGSPDKTALLSLADEVRSELTDEINGIILSGKIVEQMDSARFPLELVNFSVPLLDKLSLCSYLTLFSDGVLSVEKLLSFAYKKVTDEFKSKNILALNVIAEEILRLRMDLVNFAYHSDRSLGKLRRDSVEQSIRDFNSNETFLQRLLDFNVRPNVVDSAWRSLNKITLDTNLTSPISQVYCVKILVKSFVKHADPEHVRDATALGFLNRAKTLLEQFVLRNPGRNCPLLWRLLLWVSRQDGPDVVNTVFYRALQICPAGKSIYLDAISYILSDDRNRRSDSEWLAKTLEILVEKEGRWRLPLEELEVLMDKEEDMDSDDDSS